jgi:cell wall-associated NlpC family hydrolase
VTHRLPSRARARSLRRSLLALVLVCAASATVPPGAGAAAASAPPASGSWDTTQQRQVLAAGLMEASAGSFDGAGELSAPQANAATVALATWLQTQAQGNRQAIGVPPSTGEEPAAAVVPTVAVAHTTQSPVTVAGFDRMLVEELGLGAVAAHVQATTVAAGLQPPAYFGFEVVARYLELRYEHPVGAQRLDLFPSDPLTRAEAAWSLATVMNTSTWAISSARESLSAFELPQMSAAQRQALQLAVSRIGYPYVWGGTTDNTADGLEHGGFDCSGFVWRVFKVSGLPWGQAIRGRTAAEQAGEIASSERLRMSQLEPGDLLFFGSAHFNSKATERNIIHEGIYLGDNWVIHSSGQGVYVLPLTGSWLGSSFAWGRRVIP